MEKVRIIIGGDICPTKDNEAFFEMGKADVLFNDLIEDTRDADMRIVNLECPLIEKSNPISKIGPILGNKSSCINGLKSAEIDIVCLANNHIMDNGEDGVKNTVEQCNRLGIKTVGVGANINDARKIISYEINGCSIGVLAMAENEFSLATEKSWGANSIDIIEFIRESQVFRKKHDFIIALVHGGSEHYPYPSPRVQKLSRFFIEQGVGLVVWQHSHCPGCFEKYMDGYIVYGQGNLIFSHKTDSLDWHRGYLVDFTFNKNGNSLFNIIPYTQSYGHIGAKKMSKIDAAQFIEYIKDMSTQIYDTEVVTKKWNEFCAKEKNWYIAELAGYGRIFDRLSVFNRLDLNQFLLKILKLNKQSLNKFSNLLNCEAHYEVLVTSLKQYMHEISEK